MNNKYELIYEGKAKKVFAHDDEDKVKIEFKDDATAFNALKKEKFEGKGKLNCLISARIFEILINKNIPTYHWHGTKLDNPDWSSWSHTVAFSINKGITNPLVWIGLNAYSKSIDFPLPKCKYNWLKVVDTSMSEIFEPLTINEKSVSIKSRSSLLIISEEVFGAKNNLF